MANRRVLVKRRKAVRNIRKITRTMQLIATARFQATFNRALATKPYSEKLGELVSDLSSAAGETQHPLMETPTADKTALVVITSNRGLCGGYNANVLRQAVQHIDSQKDAGKDVDVHMIGKKGVNYFKFLGRPITRGIRDLNDDPQFSEIEPIANELMDQFVNGEISAVHVAYMAFESTSRQSPTVLQILPLAADLGDDAAAEAGGAGTAKEYEFSPEPELLLDRLLPASVRMRLFQCFIEAIVSEHVARMVAMKAATDAANDMIKSLTRQYNRARQTHITMELLDIIGGVNALEG
ncbi:MAG: ATP synthase F1 subunit gamma [Thermoanaerobaculia bacterium]|nr:ATP synthase F1 subunit gamma [Thermoanaerobaculia bacterium]